MWKYVTEFEDKIADYAGSKYAVAMDSCTNAIFMSARYLRKRYMWKQPQIVLPKQTYVSVPQMLWHLGYWLHFEDIKWKGYYPIEPLNIVDSACRFTEGMYIPNTYYCLSFHHRKILSTVRGGMVLTDDKDFVDWLRPRIYMGRNKDVMSKDDNVTIVDAYNMYMPPETAILGLEQFKKMHIGWGHRYAENKDIADSNYYSDISNLDWSRTIYDD